MTVEASEWNDEFYFFYSRTFVSRRPLCLCLSVSLSLSLSLPAIFFVIELLPDWIFSILLGASLLFVFLPAMKSFTESAGN
jgi:hypothetical protein